MRAIGEFLARLNDTSRLLIKVLVISFLTTLTAAGLGISNELNAAIIGLTLATLDVIMYFTRPNPPTPPPAIDPPGPSTVH